MDGNQKFSMKFVAQRTGLTTHVIRVWEKRYAAVVPARSQSNRRLYSARDLRRLEKLAEVTRAGHTIGQVAQLTDQELDNLSTVALSSSGRPDVAKNDGESIPRATGYFAESESCIRSCVDAINRMDAQNLSDIIDDAENSLGLRESLIAVVDPLITRLSAAKARDGASIARNSFSGSVLRSILNRKFTKRNQGKGGPLLLITTPTGQWEEVGAILADLCGQSLGWRSLYLGPDLPAEEIIAAAAQHTPSAISIVIAEHSTNNAMAEELIRIRDGVKQIPLLIGGHSSSGYAKLIRDIGGRYFSDLGNFADELLLVSQEKIH